MHRSATGQAPVCSLPWVPSCVLQELLLPMLNRHLDRHVEPLTGARHPPCSSWPDIVQGGNKATLTRATQRCSKLLDLRRWRGQRHYFPRRRAGGESFILFCRWLKCQRHPHSQRKSNFLFPQVSALRADSVRRVASSLSPTTHLASSQESTVRGRSASPCTSSQSSLGPREFCEDASKRAGFCIIQLYSPSLHHREYADCAVGATCTVSGVWLVLLSSSRWLRRTIRLGYAIHFARRPSKFRGILETSVAARNALVLREEIAVLLAKNAIESAPPAKMRQWFYSPYFIVPKKSGGLRPILDLRVQNRALHRLPFKMLTHRCMIKCVQPQDWFAAIDLKDAYLHVLILPRHRLFLWFTFKGRAWQYRVLPFGLSLSPRVHTRVVNGALAP